jgi:uncharacterized protein (TIGR02246 family)
MIQTPKASDLGKEAMTDVTDLEAITRQFEAAWNAHDMQAFGELFAADAIFVGRFATRLRGREAIVSTHQKIHETNYRGSTMTVDRPDVDLLTENIAILHFWTRLTTGPADPKGANKSTRTYKRWSFDRRIGGRLGLRKTLRSLTHRLADRSSQVRTNKPSG